MIKFSKIQRKNPIDETLAWYPRFELSGSVGADDVIEGIVEKCTLTKVDVKACLVALEEVIVEQLKNGNSVRFGDLGSFRPTFQTRKWDAAKKKWGKGGMPVPTDVYDTDGKTIKYKGVSAENIAGLNVVFTKSGKMLSKLDRRNLAFKMVAGMKEYPREQG